MRGAGHPAGAEAGSSTDQVRQHVQIMQARGTAVRQQDAAEHGTKAVRQQEMKEDERRDTMRHYTVL